MDKVLPGPVSLSFPSPQQRPLDIHFQILLILPWGMKELKNSFPFLQNARPVYCSISVQITGFMLWCQNLIPAWVSKMPRVSEVLLTEGFAYYQQPIILLNITRFSPSLFLSPRFTCLLQHRRAH